MPGGMYHASHKGIMVIRSLFYNCMYESILKKKMGGGDENVKSLKFPGRDPDPPDLPLVPCMFWINPYNIDNNFISITIYHDFFHTSGLLPVNEAEK